MNIGLVPPQLDFRNRPEADIASIPVEIKSPVAIFLLIAVAAGGYGSLYLTESHKRASAFLRAPPHSYGPLIIVKGRWSTDQTDLWYMSYEGPGQGQSVRVQVDSKAGVTIVK